MADEATDKAAAFRARLEVWIAPLSLEDKHVVLDWVEAASKRDPNDPNDIQAGLLCGLVDGQIEFGGVRNGEVTFRLTQQGHDHVLTMLVEDPGAREMLSRLNASIGKPPMSDPPAHRRAATGRPLRRRDHRAGARGLQGAASRHRRGLARGVRIQCWRARQRR